MRLLISFLFFLFSFSVSADPIDAIWKALENQDVAKARKLIRNAKANPRTSTEALMISIYLNANYEKPNDLKEFQVRFKQIKHPAEYLYALWYKDIGVKDYMEKDDEHLAYLMSLKRDHRLNGTIQASLDYILAHHYLRVRNDKMKEKYFSASGSLKNWSFAGPFDNSSGSGFDKNYDPVKMPEDDAVFISKVNAKVHWFRPKYAENDPWTTVTRYFPSSPGIAYSQTFVTSPKEQTVIIGVGFVGNIKVWVNDRLVLSEEEELKTDFDMLKRKIRLSKGVNRILVQSGYTSKTRNSSFAVRLLDDRFFPVKGLKSSPYYQPYLKNDCIAGEPIPHFSEIYFENKIKENPDDAINYLLLASVYERSGKSQERIKTLHELEKRYPKNSLTNQELIATYVALGDRTKLVKQVEMFRKIDPGNIFFAFYDFDKKMTSKDYPAAAELLEKQVKFVGDKDPNYLQNKIKLHAAKQEYDQLMETAEKGYEANPNTPYFVRLKYYILKDVSQGDGSEVKFLEDFLDKHYDYQLETLLMKAYTDKGLSEKYKKLLLKDLISHPDSKSFIYRLKNLYFQKKKYEKALAYVDRNLAINPFDADAWSNRATVLDFLDREDELIQALKNVVKYNPNSFSAREKLREKQGKKPLTDYFSKEDAYNNIENELRQPSTSDENFEYLFREKNVVLFPEGTHMQYEYLAVRVLTESGIEKWQEATIPVNNYRQNLVVIKAELIKKNGEKIEGERDYNHIVFPNVEVGDAVYFEYRLETYSSGKLRKEFWDSYLLNVWVDCKESVYRLFVPKGHELNIHAERVAKKIKKKSIDDFDIYEFVMKNPQKIKDEVYMPTGLEVGQSVFVSTLDSWSAISHWYSDLALPQIKDNYNLNEVYDEIFKTKNLRTPVEKAKAIYEYIQKNIKYSSVPFRQSNYVPQKPMKTISTQLGDCKDMSTLYHALAKKAGLKTNLVLVNTRTNGEETMKVPSTEFNHCIVRIDLPDGPMFQELTDNKLPFGCLPYNDIHAQALIIPNSGDEPYGGELIKIPQNEGVTEKIIRSTTVHIEGDNYIVQSTINAEGAIAGTKRRSYAGKNKELTKENLAYFFSNRTGKNVVLNDYTFSDLDSFDPVYTLTATFEVEDAVLNIGSLKAIKVPFIDLIVNLADFPNEKRVSPFRYWAYETVQYYESSVVINLNGEKIIDMPDDIVIHSPFIDYSISVEKISGNKVKFTRIVKTNTERDIKPEEYQNFRETVRKIAKADECYLVVK